MKSLPSLYLIWGETEPFGPKRYLFVEEAHPQQLMYCTPLVLYHRWKRRELLASTRAAIGRFYMSLVFQDKHWHEILQNNGRTRRIEE